MTHIVDPAEGQRDRTHRLQVYAPLAFAFGEGVFGKGLHHEQQ